MRLSNLATTRCVSFASLFGCLFLSVSPPGAEASETAKSASVPPKANQVAPRIPVGFRLANWSLAEPYTHTGWAREIVHETSGIGMVYVPAGSFLMGSQANEENRQPDEIQHKVVLTQGFYLGKFELTQKQWQQVMGSTIQKQRDRENPKAPLVGIGLDMPMYFVNWDDAQELCLKLGAGFRLPTEAEWEYACRAGTTGAYAGPIKEMGWTPENSGRASINAEAILKRSEGGYHQYVALLVKNGCCPHPVGGKKANAWGLYDMHGNLWEWCQDWYGPVDAKEATDPTGPGQGTERVNRGGSWLEVGFCARSAMRMKDPKEGRGFNLGFRVAFSPADSREPGRSERKEGARQTLADQVPRAESPTPIERAPNPSTNGWPTAFRLWQLPLGCCCYVIAPTNSQSAIVIDPGMSAKDLIQFMEGTNLVVKYVLLTHDHWDHAKAVPEIMKRYKDATLICHEDCPELARLRPKIGAHRVAAIKGHGLDNSSGTITMEGLTLKACRVSEHAIGHMVFYLGAGGEHHLFSGDVGNIKASCGNDKVRQYLPDLPEALVVWRGHGGPFTAWVADLLNEKPAAPPRTPVETNDLKTSLPARVATTNAAAALFLSRLENEVLMELNLARADPPKYAEFLRQYRKEFINDFDRRGKGNTIIRTKGGVMAVDEAIEYLGKAKGLPPLKASECLSLAAKDHVEVIGKSRLMGHDGADGSTMEQRMARYGKWEATASENIVYGEDTARDIVIHWIIDDGLPSRGQRRNIFAADFHAVGVAFGVHTTWRYMCVADFAGGFQDDPMAVGNRKKETRP